MASTFFSRLRTAVLNGNKRPIIGQESGLLESVEVLIGQGKFRLCNYRLFPSVRFSTLAELQLASTSPTRRCFWLQDRICS